MHDNCGNKVPTLNQLHWTVCQVPHSVIPPSYSLLNQIIGSRPPAQESTLHCPVMLAKIITTSNEMFRQLHMTLPALLRIQECILVRLSREQVDGKGGVPPVRGCLHYRRYFHFGILVIVAFALARYRSELRYRPEEIIHHGLPYGLLYLLHGCAPQLSPIQQAFRLPPIRLQLPTLCAIVLLVSVNLSSPPRLGRIPRDPTQAPKVLLHNLGITVIIQLQPIHFQSHQRSREFDHGHHARNRFHPSIHLSRQQFHIRYHQIGIGLFERIPIGDDEPIVLPQYFFARCRVRVDLPRVLWIFAEEGKVGGARSRLGECLNGGVGGFELE
mmetsp:Transcript_10156/g.21393  ORF Transcript_10156/g.21393 Transcript_10156/m.21393 type:complete len:328 (+) Transcript_10156:17-1000(+)